MGILEQTKIVYKKAVNDKNYGVILDSIVNAYYDSCNCNHNDFIDIGYYRTNNGNIILSNREESSFRCIVCKECNQEIYLIKTLHDDWDTKFKSNDSININGMSKQCKIKTKKQLK